MPLSGMAASPVESKLTKQNVNNPDSKHNTLNHQQNTNSQVNKMDWFKWLIRAILAGMSIGIGGIVFIQTTVACGPEFKWVGAFLFSIGLYSVLTYGFNLYTGKVGYILENDRIYLLEVLVTIIGNFIGCFIMGYFFQFDYAVAMCEGKLENFEFLDALMKGVMCGILMYIAVDAYKSKKSYLATFICVPVFIMAGFEHSIADMFYFSSAMMWTPEAFLFIAVILLGNLIGCCLIPAYRMYVNKENTQTQ